MTDQPGRIGRYRPADRRAIPLALVPTQRPAAQQYVAPHGAPLTPDELRLQREHWRDTQPTVTRCVFCDWQHEGTAGEGREAAVEHRALEHPDKQNRAGRRKRMGWSKDGDQAARARDRKERNQVRAEREDADRLAKIEAGRLRNPSGRPPLAAEAERALPASESEPTPDSAVLPVTQAAAGTAEPVGRPELPVHVQRGLRRPEYRAEWERARRAGEYAA